MLDVFAIAKAEERPEADRAWFALNPGELYPATLGHVRQVLEGPRPAEPLGQLYDRARALPVEILTAVAETPSKAAYSNALVLQRAEALEVARLWFTEMLQQAVGGPIGVHILKDERFKL